MSLAEFQDLQQNQGAVWTKDVADSIRTIEFGPDGFPVVPSFEPIGPPEEAVHFGRPHKEFESADSRAALFDLSRRANLQLVGADRQKFLNGFCTADVGRLKPGEGCEAFVPNIKGKVLAHVFAFAAADSLWLETAPACLPTLIKHLSKYVISEDVELIPKSDEVGELYLSGPQAMAKLAELAGEIPSLPLYGHANVKIGPSDVSLRRVDWLGAPGCLLCLPREQLAACWSQLTSAGILPAGIAVFHALRIRAGFPLYGIDVTEDNLAQEVARTKQAIDFEKGCYLGQEPIARIDAIGHVNRELRRLKLKSASAPVPGAIIKNAEKKDIGRVTSYAMLPVENVPIALAYLHRNSLEPGTQILVDCEGEEVAATVL